MQPKNIEVVIGGDESPVSPTSKSRSAGHIYRDLVRTDKLFRSITTKELQKFKINLMQWLILGVIAEGSEDGTAVTEVSRRLGLSLGQTSTLNTSLIHQKLVRHRTDRTDHRNRYLVLSARGRVVLKNAEAAVWSALDVWLKAIPKQQLAFYYRVNQSLAESPKGHGKIY